jgi:hypothetical protein
MSRNCIVCGTILKYEGTLRCKPCWSNIIKNEGNHQWKGNQVGYGALHGWIRRRKEKTNLCELCNKRPPKDLANISGQYKRDINDYKWICRRCHMKEDGRMFNFINSSKTYIRLNKIKKICLNCNKNFEVIPSHDYRKCCSKKCSSELISKEKRFYGNQFINKNREKLITFHQQNHTHKDKEIDQNDLSMISDTN